MIWVSRFIEVDVPYPEPICGHDEFLGRAAKDFLSQGIGKYSDVIPEVMRNTTRLISVTEQCH
jgi:hypothetical protein